MRVMQYPKAWGVKNTFPEAILEFDNLSLLHLDGFLQTLIHWFLVFKRNLIIYNTIWFNSQGNEIIVSQASSYQTDWNNFLIP